MLFYCMACRGMVIQGDPFTVMVNVVPLLIHCSASGVPF